MKFMQQKNNRENRIDRFVKRNNFAFESQKKLGYRSCHFVPNEDDRDYEEVKQRFEKLGFMIKTGYEGTLMMHW